jgi:hypothetical protein
MHVLVCIYRFAIFGVFRSTKDRKKDSKNVIFYQSDQIGRYFTLGRLIKKYRTST